MSQNSQSGEEVFIVAPNLPRKYAPPTPPPPPPLINDTLMRHRVNSIRLKVVLKTPPRGQGTCFASAHLQDREGTVIRTCAFGKDAMRMYSKLNFNFEYDFTNLLPKPKSKLQRAPDTVDLPHEYLFNTYSRILEVCFSVSKLQF